MNKSPQILILAGGKGTRLYPLTQALPKVLIPIKKRPFLEYLLEHFMAQGFDRFVLSVGYLAEQIIAHFGDGKSFGCHISYVSEKELLGTGGAIRKAAPLLDETFIATNGDTLLEIELAALYDFHLQEQTELTMVTMEVADRSRYGSLAVECKRVMRFEEKRPDAGPGPINCGMYVICRSVIISVPEEVFSFEHDFLPRFAGRIAAYPTQGFFIDMGTHAALSELEHSIEGLRQKSHC